MTLTNTQQRGYMQLVFNIFRHCSGLKVLSLIPSLYCLYFTFSDTVVEGLAVDPISRLIFYSDSGTGTVNLVSIDGTASKVVTSRNIGKPRGLALDSANGLVSNKIHFITIYIISL